MAKTVLQKIEELQYFDGLRSMKEVLKNIFKNVTELEINNIIVGRLSARNINVTPVGGGGEETSLRIGKRYIVRTLTAGDNFTNVGFVAINVPFVATATTPTLHTTSQLIYLSADTTIIFNDVDPALKVELNFDFDESNYKTNFIITNNKFDINKVYPILPSAEVKTTNLITGNPGTYYFKIEVYN